MDNQATRNSLKGIAIVGMAGRFPGAKNVDQFWQNLCDGVESISFFTADELLASNVEPSSLHDPNYVKAGAVLEDIDMFDARFFNFSPREAEVMDPQHRLFLECAWEALENSGYDSERIKGLTGVYAGGNFSSYLHDNLLANYGLARSLGVELVTISNDKDYIPTRVSYKLNLRGPSLNVSTACSTSLVAVHLACRGLLSYECDLALAGGISIQSPQKAGYFYQKGGVTSPDGHCRAFDANSQGTVFGSGVGIVVLKRLKDALEDGDYIYAVIKGSAINNDGSLKVGYTAPSVDGQAEVIAESQAIAGINPSTITYIETHGTGTTLGDPIEIRALENVFRASTQQKGFCGIGAVKTNVGHLNSAAGITGLIKTVLALKHKMLPPSLNFESSNPEIDFANSPFYVNTELSPWHANGTPRRAGVSSFGIGGTNAHVVLEEAPTVEPSSKSRPWQLLVLSAKTSSALNNATDNLAQFLHSELNLADVAYTSSVGRQTFNHRRILVCQDIEDAKNTLSVLDSKRVLTRCQEPKERPVIFMFSGQGAQYVNMAQELYQNEPTFAAQVDKCCKLLKPHLGIDLRQILYPSEEQTQVASVQLQQTAITQPALFVIEYALAQLWIEWGVHPTAMIGHSIGEYVAATLAGVFSLEDALTVVAARGKLMQELPSGSMLAIPLPEAEVRSLLSKDLSLAAVNGSSSSVVSGPTEAIEVLEKQLTSQGIECHRLHTSHAFHSSMMEPILKSFTQRLSPIRLNSPEIPYISDVTGTWITPGQAKSPDYWATHLRQTVRMSEGLQALLKEPNQILLEIGPGRTLTTLANRHPDKKAEQVILSSVRHPKESCSDFEFLLKALGQLWLAGVEVDWSGFYTHEHRHRLPLPSYPFERQRYWIEAAKQSTGQYQPLPTPQNLWNSLVQAGQMQANAETSEFDQQTYLKSKPSLEALCLAYINIALRQLDAFGSPSQSYSPKELLEQCQIIPRYRQLLSRWLQVLVNHDQLQQNGELLSNLVPCSADSFNALLEEVKLTWTHTPAVADLVQRCGENLVSVIRGEQEPLVFFQDVIYDSDETARANKQFPVNAYYNGILKAIVKQMVDVLSPAVNLRILEIGGGQGIATREILPVLPPNRTSYAFTDVGAAFLNSGKKKFSAYPFIDYRFLDIEKPPSQQGYEDHSFDIVIAVNVLHVTKSMGETLQHVRSLLAPNGLLLIWELTQDSLPFETTWGLLMNPPEDVQRSQGNPFLSKQQWQEGLLSNGFVEVEAFPETEALGQHILVAQASSSADLSVPAAFTQRLVQRYTEQSHQVLSGKKQDLADWFYTPSWKRFIPPQPFQSEIHKVHSECWLVFVDKCGLATQILKQLNLEAQNVVTVKIGERFSCESKLDASQPDYTINPSLRDDYDALLKELLALDLRPTRILHLWNVTTLQNDTSLRLDVVNQSQDQGFYSLLFLAQALEKQHLADELQIEVISNNCQSVTGEEVIALEKSILLGAVRVIPLEYPNIRCRSIDVLLPEAGSGQREKLVKSLLAEFNINDKSEQIIAYRGVHRWVQSFEPIQLDETFEKTPRLRNRGVYLITGGLGAIGLALASYLAKTLQAKLILFGRSSFPSKDKWDEWLINHDNDHEISQKILKLKEFERFGAEVLVTSADVSNLEQMHQMITQSQKSFGQINGVIHSAGILGDSMIGRKTREEIEGVLTPKVKGTLVLDAILKDVELDFMVLCSSGSSIQPLFGQVSYCAANNFLDAFAHYKNSTNRGFTVSINWDGWQEGGMGVQGVRRLERALKLAERQSQEVKHPLLDQCLVEDANCKIYISKLQVNKHWVLDEHRVLDKATLPGTGYLEMIKGAWENYTQQETLEIQEVHFLKPLVIEEHKEKEVRTILQDQENVVEFVVTSQSSSELKTWVEHARGKITRLELGLPEKLDIEQIKEKFSQQKLTVNESKLRTPSKFLKFGKRWNNLQWMGHSENQGLAFLELPEVYAEDLESYKLHPALLDIANAFFTLRFQDEESFYLPFSYKGFKIAGTLPRKVLSYIRVLEGSESSEETLRLNITISNQQGVKLVEVEEYTLRRVNQAQANKNIAQQSIVVGDQFSLDLSAVSLHEPIIAVNQLSGEIRQDWLLPSEGVKAFERILASTFSQVVVSTVDFFTRSKRDRTYGALSSSQNLEVFSKSVQPTHSRPQLSSEYISPSHETETAIVEIWQKVLGIKQIGIHDNFFELGGDSLLATQVISQINKILHTDLSVGDMFEIPTVAGTFERLQTMGLTTQMPQFSTNGLLNKREEIEF